MIAPASLPPTLARLPFWVAYREEQRGDRKTKVPISPRTGGHASVTDPDTWADLEKALAAQGDGIGFVLNDEDPLLEPIAGVDLDGCVGPNGEIAPWARRIIEALNTYAEFSPSGSGIHLFARGSLPADGRKKTLDEPKVCDKAPAVEMYSRARFLTVTGNHVEGTPLDVEDRQEELRTLYDRFFGDSPPLTSSNGEAHLDQTEPSSPTDRLLAERILHDHPAILQAWTKDESAGDFAFCSEAARIVGANPQAIDRIFRASSLFSRGDRAQKWMRRGDSYAARTIQRAIGAAVKEDAPSPEADSLFDDLRTLQDRLERPTEIPYPLITDLLWPQSIAMLFGPTGVGKTTFLINLALHAATAPRDASPEDPPAFDFTRGLPLPTRRLRVLFVGAEDTTPMFEHERLTQEVIDRYGRDASFQFLCKRITLASRTGETDVARFIRGVQARGPFDLIIFDPLMRFHTGLKENDNGEMSQVMAAFDEIRTQTGAAIIFSHHTGKDTTHSLKYDRRSRSDTTAPRGASVLADQSHAVLSLTGGKGKTLVLTWAKCNYARLPAASVFERSEGGVLVPVTEVSKVERVVILLRQLTLQGNTPSLSRSHLISQFAETENVAERTARRTVERAEELDLIVRVNLEEEPDEQGRYVTLPAA
jgi:putative DNA primase/helicase